MKYVWVWLLLFGWACNNKPETNQVTTPRPRIQDSNNASRTAANPYIGVDVSPMDLSYLPVDYPKLSVKRPSPVARVLYSRPQKQGRAIFGKLIPYGQPWRLGANETTELEVFQPMTIQNTTIQKGKYILYCIPEENQWTIIFNKNLYSWGLDLDSTKDLHRFTIPATRKKQAIEFFTIVFQPAASGADLVMAWDDIEARLPIQYTEK